MSAWALRSVMHDDGLSSSSASPISASKRASWASSARASGSPARTRPRPPPRVSAEGPALHLSSPVAAVDRHRGGPSSPQSSGARRLSGWMPMAATTTDTRGQLQHAGASPEVGGLLAHAHHALAGRPSSRAKRFASKKRGRCSGRGCQRWGSGHTPSFGGALFTSQMPTQTSTSAPMYCQRKSGSPLSNGTEQDVYHRVHEAEDGDAADGVVFMSKAQMTYPRRR